MAVSQKRKGAKHGRKTVRTATARETAAPLPKLTPKQEKFARAYIELGSGAKAYRLAYNAAGMNGNVIRVQASRLLDHPGVALMVMQLREELADTHKVTADRLIEEAAAIAFADPRGVAKWGTFPTKRITKDGDVIEDERSAVHVFNSDEIDDEAAACISEISEGQHGIKIKFHDKSNAIEKLAKMMRLYEDENDKKHAHITVEIVPIAPIPKPTGKSRVRVRVAA